MEQRIEVPPGSTDRVHDAWVDHHERLWRSLLAWSGNADIATEAVAEAFAQAARRGAAVHDVGRWVWRDDPSTDRWAQLDTPPIGGYAPELTLGGDIVFRPDRAQPKVVRLTG